MYNIWTGVGDGEFFFWKVILVVVFFFLGSGLKSGVKRGFWEVVEEVLIIGFIYSGRCRGYVS